MGNDDWTPPGNPPKLTPTFNEPPAPPPAPPAWSKAERDQLEQRIAKPELEPKLTPSGKLEQEVNQRLDDANRARLAYINQMMEQRRGKAEREFNRVARDGQER